MTPVAEEYAPRNNGEGPSKLSLARDGTEDSHELGGEGKNDKDASLDAHLHHDLTSTAAESKQERQRLRQEENLKAWEALAHAPKQRWAPTKFRTEAPHAPVIDHRLEEEAAAHQAAQEAGYEGRRVRKFLQRRTVDYNESFLKWRLHRNLTTCVRNDQLVRPGVNHIVELLPAAAYRSSAQAVTTNLVHSSTNKIRCPVNVIRWTPEGRRLLTGSSSGEYTLWNGLTFNFETILQAHDHAIRAIEYTKSGAWIVSGDQGGVIKYFQSNMNNLQMINAHREAVRDLSFSPDDSRFVTASDDSTMKLWSFEEAREESTLKGHGWDVKAVDWHPYKGLLVSGSKDNLVKFWDPRTGTTLATYHGHKGTVQAVQWSNDGNLVATASRDQVLKLYDIRAMAELHTLKGHPNDVCSVSWHPDHRDLLVSGGSEGSMMFWSLNAADPAVPVHSMLNAHESNIWSLQWHPLGHILGSGSNDHSTRFWERARPEDGRLAREGHETDAQLANKQLRFNKAARGGGEDWDDDTSFIPGLGTAAKSQPASSAPGGNVNVAQDSSIPGLGGSVGKGPARPPQAAPMAPQRAEPTPYNGDAVPGFGQTGVVPPSMPFNGYAQPTREPQGFVPPPREGSGFVPPPREGGMGGPAFTRPPPSQPQQYGGGGFQSGFAQQQTGRGFVPPPREGSGGPPYANGGGGYGARSLGSAPGQGFVPPPREQQQFNNAPFGNAPAGLGGTQPPSGPRGAGVRGPYNQGGSGGYYRQ